MVSSNPAQSSTTEQHVGEQDQAWSGSHVATKHNEVVAANPGADPLKRGWGANQSTGVPGITTVTPTITSGAEVPAGMTGTNRFGVASIQAAQKASCSGLGAAVTGTTGSVPPGTSQIRASNGVDFNGMNPEMMARVNQMFADMPASVKASGTRVIDAYRSPARQAIYYKRYLAGTGGMAAAPGRSKHQWGMAMDMHDPTGWVHQNAGRYGLVFPLGRADWGHMQMAGANGAMTGSYGAGAAQLARTDAAAKMGVKTNVEATMMGIINNPMVTAWWKQVRGDPNYAHHTIKWLEVNGPNPAAAKAFAAFCPGQISFENSTPVEHINIWLQTYFRPYQGLGAGQWPGITGSGPVQNYNGLYQNLSNMDAMCGVSQEQISQARNQLEKTMNSYIQQAMSGGLSHLLHGFFGGGADTGGHGSTSGGGNGGGHATDTSEDTNSHAVNPEDFDDYHLNPAIEYALNNTQGEVELWNAMTGFGILNPNPQGFSGFTATGK